MLLGKLGPRVEISRLRKSFGAAVAVRDVSVTIEPAEFVTILGPSGCGKTTVLKMIAGLIATNGGEIAFGGEHIDHLPPNRRNVGLVFQNYALFPHMNVSENIAYGLRMRRWPRERRKARVTDMLALVRLEGLGERKPDQLSGGQQQRVALARALAFSPDLLLMDEPLSNLDARFREEMRTQLRDIQRRARQTTILVTHDQDEALVMSDRIVLMNNGTIEQIDAPEQLYSMPQTEFAARFIGTSNIVYGRYCRDGDAGLVRVDGLDVPLPASTRAAAVGPSGSPVAACIRPEQIVVRPRGVGREIRSDWPLAFATAGRVCEIVFRGGSIKLGLSVTGLGIVRCERPAAELQGLTYGDHVEVGIVDCHVIPREDQP